MCTERWIGNMRTILTSDHRSHYYRRSQLSKRSVTVQKRFRIAAALQKKTLSVFRIYETVERREIAVKALIAYGYKYLVLFKDVSGFGLQGCFHAEWQNENSALYLDR